MYIYDAVQALAAAYNPVLHLTLSACLSVSVLFSFLLPNFVFFQYFFLIQPSILSSHLPPRRASGRAAPKSCVPWYISPSHAAPSGYLAALHRSNRWPGTVWTVGSRQASSSQIIGKLMDQMLLFLCITTIFLFHSGAPASAGWTGLFSHKRQLHGRGPDAFAPPCPLPIQHPPEQGRPVQKSSLGSHLPFRIQT